MTHAFKTLAALEKSAFLQGAIDSTYNYGKRGLAALGAVPKAVYAMGASPFSGSTENKTLGGMVQGMADAGSGSLGQSVAAMGSPTGVAPVAQKPALGYSPAPPPNLNKPYWEQPVQASTPQAWESGASSPKTPAAAPPMLASTPPAITPPQSEGWASYLAANPSMAGPTPPRPSMPPALASFAPPTRTLPQIAGGYTQPAAPGQPTAAQIAQYERGTASKYRTNSAMDRFAMQRLMAGNKDWADVNAFRAHQRKSASVNKLVAETPKSTYLDMLVATYL